MKNGVCFLVMAIALALTGCTTLGQHDAQDIRLLPYVEMARHEAETNPPPLTGEFKSSVQEVARR